ncbi:MAG: ATP-binding protein [Patescibacteria group bacterium]
MQTMTANTLTIEILLGVLALTATSALGAIIHIRNPKSWTHRLFLLLAIAIDFYIIVNFLSLHPPRQTPDDQLFWIRAVMFVTSFIGPILVLLVHTFPGHRITMRRRFIALLLFLMIASAAASLMPFVFQSIHYPEGEPIPVPGPGMPVFFLDFIGLFILSFIILILKHRRAQGEEKMKLRHLLAGVIASFSLMGISTVIFVVILRTSAFVFLGPIFPVILITFIAYAIVRHGFLDIRLIVARAFLYSILIGIVATIYALTFFSVVTFFFGIVPELEVLLAGVLLTTLVALTFDTLRAVTGRVSDRIFYKGRYDTGELLSRLTHAMAETTDLEKIAMLIVQNLADELRINRSALLIVDKHVVTQTFQTGFTDELLTTKPDFEKLFHNPVSERQFFLFEELPENPLKQFFRSADIAVAVPIRVENREVAILLLGSKRSGGAYYIYDLQFLNIFAVEAGIALQNAKAFDEIKKFSKELEARVEERTRDLVAVQERELAQAREVARLKDEFVFVAAHDLRTPITAIRGFLELVSESTASFPADVKEHLRAIAMASDHLRQLVNDLLSVARSETGALKIDRRDVDIMPIINDVVAELQPLADERSVAIKVHTGGPLPHFPADPHWLKEILTNLTSNAIKYNRKRGKVDITAFVADASCIIEVRDTGYGIPEAQQKDIFQKFFRATTRETQDVLGTGLGLFISRMLVEKMGGKLFFTSTKGKGSTFSFSLPLPV